MKRSAIIIASYILILLLGSCGGSKYEERLTLLDSLVAERPDSVYHLLCDMEQEVSRESKSTRMRYELLKADAQNKAYIDFTTDSVMKVVADYYDHHGSANEKMLAFYLLGCTYRDLKDTPMQLQCFLEATEKADTTRQDCDLYTLSAIYGQMANLYDAQFLPDEELKALKKCQRIAERDNDTLSAISFYLLQTRAYYLKNMPDSVLSITEKARARYLEIDQATKAARTLGLAISILTDRGEYEKAGLLMQEFEKNSGYFDDSGNIDIRRVVYLHDKGRHALHHNNFDKAIKCFLKLIEGNEKVLGYNGLLLAYEKIGAIDSIAKYSKLYAAANDSSFLGNNAQFITQMNSMYNYNRQQKIAEQKVNEAHRAKLKLNIFMLISVLSLAGIVQFVIRMKKNKDKEIIAMTHSYYNAMTQKNHIENEISQLQKKANAMEGMLKQQISDTENTLEKEKEYLKKDVKNRDAIINELTIEVETNKNLLIQKEKELSALQHQVKFYSANIDLDNLDKKINAFQRTDIIKKVNQSIKFTKSEMKLTESEWENFDELYSKYFPKYYNYISTCLSLNTAEKRICLLIPIRYSPTQLAAILGRTRQRVTNLRASANTKLFGTDSASTLNNNLAKLFKSMD